MPRIADVLERESRSVDLERGDFERLLGRRERKERNRRIRAGTVGVTVALVMGIVLARSLTSDRIPADRPVEPRPAPAASGTLAYVLDGDIYVADADGSNAVKIADGRPAEECNDVGEYWAEGPMWSPDGRYLAYRRFTDCSSFERRLPDVVISDAEGNVLATFPSGGWGIAWSPDSTRVAVWDSFSETIGVYGVDGARQTQLTMPSGSSASGDRDPVWMPDGTSLMDEHVELPLDGGTPRELPWGADAYSPDGTRVAYVQNESLVVAAADGSDAREVFPDPVRNVAWSPNGDRIAFASEDGTELRLLDVATGTATLLTEMDGPDRLLDVFGANLEFSPEGDRLLFSTTHLKGGGESSSLWSINADGSGLRRLVTGTAWGDWLSR